ncbi:MAG: zinc ribbon domain-containing protein [Promethearchaeota archaeon]
MTETSLFPEPIRRVLIEGCDQLRKSALIWALGILIIPAIIGWIVQAFGFLKLAKLEYITYHEPTEPQSTKRSYNVQSVPLIVATYPETDKMGTSLFCPYCGSKLSEKAKFCLVCGSQIN